MPPARALTVGLAAATALAAATRPWWSAWWPCPACQGGGHYRHWLGLPVEWYAAAALLGIGALALAGRPRPAAWLALLTAGGSLWFLWVAWRLALWCPSCALIHAGVLATALAALWQAGAPRRGDACALALGFLGLHFAFHPGVVEDGPAPAVPAHNQHAAATADRAAIDARRRQGQPDAPLVLTIVVDPHCPRCAELHGPLHAALRPAVEAGRVELVTRFLLRASMPSGADLARHALAAAGPREFAAVLGLVLGAREGLDWTALRPRLAEVLDPAPIEARARAEAGAIAAVLAEDQAWLQRQRVRTAPAALLADRQGALRQRWEGRAVEPAAIAAALRE